MSTAEPTEALNLVCGHCDSIVRIPVARMSQAPRCPKCHHAVFEGKPIALNAGNFERHIGRNDLPVVVDFWAPWCGPCLAMAPFFESVAKKMETRLRFAKLDTEAEPIPAGRFNIRSIPTLIVFRHGKEIARQSGAMDAANLARWLASAIA